MIFSMWAILIFTVILFSIGGIFFHLGESNNDEFDE